MLLTKAFMGSSGGGGGGSSDYSIATVQVSINDDSILYLPVIVDLPAPINVGFSAARVDDSVVNVILYKGMARGAINGSTNVEVTGDITYRNGVVTVNGNGTISIG